MSSPIVWNVDPIIGRMGPLVLRYYGICFAVALLTGFAVWYRRVRRYGESEEFAWNWLWISVPAVLIGGRLGFCFFYQPRYYLANPLRILALADGGIASHGVAVGLALALWVFARRNGITWLKLSDYFAPAVAIARGWVRVGNFFNSEILGHATSVPWAVVFARHDAIPRHPAQLYDGLIGPVTFLVLREVERRRIRPIGSGLIAGTFLTVFFGLRIFVEQFKDFWVEQLREMTPFRQIEQWLGVPIHTGQWLSVVPACIGLFLLVQALRNTQRSP
ncbi:MAG: prolipoprotein diacylglyceryl transferase [Gemmatimonadaceae bacterium]|nr:prolipoprotein diacylglyceryl transferase [Gemmatimonadaceae bacterium]